MKTEIKGAPAFAYLDVTLEPGERIIAESDAMSSMAADLEMTTKLNGGLIRGLLRKYFGGETLFINQFKNETDDQRQLTLVQPCPGDLGHVELGGEGKGEHFCLQPGAFLACSEGIKMGLKWAGFVSYIAHEGLFKIVVSGNGQR
jgi:uncharacterized protein (TIGR00266 family)